MDCAVEVGFGGGHCPNSSGRNRVILRFGIRSRMVNVHVLHLGGCCGLTVSTELVVEFGEVEFSLWAAEKH